MRLFKSHKPVNPNVKYNSESNSQQSEPLLNSSFPVNPNVKYNSESNSQR